MGKQMIVDGKIVITKELLSEYFIEFYRGDITGAVKLIKKLNDGMVAELMSYDFTFAVLKMLVNELNNEELKCCSDEYLLDVINELKSLLFIDSKDDVVKVPPVLKCSISSSKRQAKVWCPYCKEYHFHGADPDLLAGELSHRVAHCWSENSPFKETGYYLKIDPPH